MALFAVAFALNRADRPLHQIVSKEKDRLTPRSWLDLTLEETDPILHQPRRFIVQDGLRFVSTHRYHSFYQDLIRRPKPF